MPKPGDPTITLATMLKRKKSELEVGQEEDTRDGKRLKVVFKRFGIWMQVGRCEQEVPTRE